MRRVLIIFCYVHVADFYNIEELLKLKESSLLKAATWTVVNEYFTDRANWHTQFITRTNGTNYWFQDLMSDIIKDVEAVPMIKNNIEIFPDNYCRVFFIDSYDSIRFV